MLKEQGAVFFTISDARVLHNKLVLEATSAKAFFLFIFLYIYANRSQIMSGRDGERHF